jgi:hypothetical protein
MPFKSPILFYGISAEVGLLNNSAEILFSDKNLPCCTFKDGNGYQYSLGAHSELWKSSNLAYGLDFTISNKHSRFLGNSDTLPIRTGEKFITQYEFISNISNILIEPSIKYRILNTHFNVNFGIQFGFQFSSSSEHNEYVISPEDWPWKSKNLSSELPFDLNLIVLNPRISIGYDYSLLDGVYVTPSIVYSLPLLSVASGNSWVYQTILFKVALNYGGFIFIE